MATLLDDPANAAALEALTAQYGAVTPGRLTNYGEGVTGYEGGRTLHNSKYGLYSGGDTGNVVWNGNAWTPVPDAGDGSLFASWAGDIAGFAGAAAGAYGLAAGLGSLSSMASLGEGFGAEGVLGSSADWGLGAEGFGGEGILGSAADWGLSGGGSWWDTALQTLGQLGGSGGAKGAGDSDGFLGDLMSIAKPLMSIGSGIYGMTEADEMRQQAEESRRRADPWGTSGGRGLADAQLQELMRNPGQVAARDPSYELRMQGAKRANAIYGSDSGAMAVAGANASTDWYNQRLGQLGGLAGAAGSPVSGEQIGMSGQLGANDLASRGLASIGYGVTRAGNSGMPAEVEQWLRSQGIL